MLKRQPSLILTFEETAQAMAVEAICMDRKLPGRLIPVPRQITAGCGLAWKAAPGDKEILCSALVKAGLFWSQAYIVEV